MSGGTTYLALISDAAARQPNRPLLADEHGRSLTARQLHDAACATAAAFAERGIGAGTLVSWQLPTTLETMVVMAALARLGAMQNPIVPILREHEVGFITGQLATEYLVVPELWRGFDHSGLARALSSDRGFDVITLDLATPPAAGELRLPQAGAEALAAPLDTAATPDGSTTRREPRHPPKGSATPTRRSWPARQALSAWSVPLAAM
jgi:cyclohexanecarboxylate-CoA ligase